jgi:HEAT repeat protein
MSNSQIGTVRQKDDAVGPLTLDFLVARLSDGDRRVRRGAVAALRNLGDKRAVDPLIFALSWELARGAVSYPVVAKIIDTLAKTPNRRALNALEKVESQMTDRESAGCPILLPQDVVTYHDMGDGRIQLAVPRKLHFKVLDVMRRMSVKINYRQEEMAAQLDEYQREAIQAEVDRVMPILTPVFQDYDQPKSYPANTFNDVGRGTRTMAIPRRSPSPATQWLK